ncbi:MAG: acetyl-CoA carboxylase biotin carboxylase subunit [Acidobacteria bacterium]|nr:acetyl-CoA carboxylase biotin carboxylase subunit [Acidobacteriota bacterium]
MKVLVANRGEIAIRVMRACRDMEIATVAVYSDCDRTAPFVRYADEAVALGGNTPGESYLRIDKIIDAARRTGAFAIHPGYGFLAENPRFARAVREAGLTFIGPPAEVMELLGGKTAARQVAVEAGVPVVPGTDGPLPEELPEAEVAAIAADIGYPLLVKAVAGGGGKGMRVAASPEELASASRTARSEAKSAFGDAAIYFERRLSRPRHIEIQFLGDEHGTVLPFVERECSIQRRHQKVIEETPSLAVSPELRQALADAAAAVARRAKYVNAGTAEFLVDETGHFYFLEVNTRLQVEHPITEMITGLDLVQWQIRIARGEKLTLDPERLLTPRGHAIECRVYAEDPERTFMPAPGLIRQLRSPAGPGVRDDSGVAAGFEIPIYYDSLISKLIAWGEDREQAIARMTRALSEYIVGGVTTTIPFFQWILRDPNFLAGRFDVTFLDRVLAAREGQPFQEVSSQSEEAAVIGAALHTYMQGLMRAGAANRSAARSSWQRVARLEGQRTSHGLVP